MGCGWSKQPAAANLHGEAGAKIASPGKRAIAGLTAVVLSKFVNHGAGVPLAGTELEDIFDTLGLPSVVRDAVNADEFADVACFVREVERCVLANPIFVGVGASWAAMPTKEKAAALPAASAERDEEVRLSVYYCFALHAVGKAMMYEPKGGPCWKTLMDAFEAKRDSAEWKKYTNLFERMKVMTVNMPFKRYKAVKTGEKTIDGRAGGGLTLSLNILEAMYQDVKLGNFDNAAAGFELMSESYDRKPIKGCGNDIHKEWVPEGGEEIGICEGTSPLPLMWNNLYSSWNMAFCSSYVNSPMYFAKLLAPIVAGLYQDVTPGLYIMPRVICLYLHIQYEIVNRGKFKSQKPIISQPGGGSRPFSDWRIEPLTKLWGHINEGAADQYQEKLEATIDENYGPLAELGYDFRRARKQAAWAPLKGSIVTFTGQLFDGSLPGHEEEEREIRFFKGISAEHAEGDNAGAGGDYVTPG